MIRRNGRRILLVSHSGGEMVVLVVCVCVVVVVVGGVAHTLQNELLSLKAKSCMMVKQ